MTNDIDARLSKLSGAHRELLDALLKGGSAVAQNPTVYRAPRTATERILADIWSEAFNAPVGIDDNFFELGGDSILSIQIVAKAQRRGLSLSSAELFGQPSIAALADRLDTQTAEGADAGTAGGSLSLPIDSKEAETLLTAVRASQLVLNAVPPVPLERMRAAVRILSLNHPMFGLRWRPGTVPVLPDVPSDSAVGFRAVEADVSSCRTKEEAIQGLLDTLPGALDALAGPLALVAALHDAVGAVHAVILCIHPLIADRQPLEVMAFALSTGCRPALDDTMQSRASLSIVAANPETTRSSPPGSARAIGQRLELFSAKLDAADHERLVGEFAPSSLVPMKDILLASTVAALRKTWGHSVSTIELVFSRRPGTAAQASSVGSFADRAHMLVDPTQVEALALLLKTCRARLREAIASPRAMAPGTTSCDFTVFHEGNYVHPPEAAGFEPSHFEALLPRPAHAERRLAYLGWTCGPEGLHMRWWYGVACQADQLATLWQHFQHALRSYLDQKDAILQRTISPDDFPKTRMSERDLKTLFSSGGH